MEQYDLRFLRQDPFQSRSMGIICTQAQKIVEEGISSDMALDII